MYRAVYLSENDRNLAHGIAEHIIEYTKLSEIMVGKVATQCVAAAGRSQEARFTFAYYKGNRP